MEFLAEKVPKLSQNGTKSASGTAPTASRKKSRREASICRAGTVHHLTLKDRIIRKRFAEEQVDNADFSCFSDASSVSLIRGGGERQWVLNGDQADLREHQCDAVKVRCWAAVGIGYKSPLVVFPVKDPYDPRRAFRLNSDRTSLCA